MTKVYVGIGHGGNDPGAVANGYKEKDLTLAIGKACYDELVRHGVNAKISRTTDKYMSVNEKVKVSLLPKSAQLVTELFTAAKSSPPAFSSPTRLRRLSQSAQTLRPFTIPQTLTASLSAKRL